MKLAEKLAAVEVAPAEGPKPKRKRPANARAKQVRKQVVDEVRKNSSGLDDSTLRRRVTETAGRVLKDEKAAENMASDLVGYGPLDEFLSDPSVNEVMCNGHDDVWVERDGRIEPAGVSFSDTEHYRAVIDRIVAGVGRRLDEACPMVDARLPDGSRVNIVIPPLTQHEPAMTIRRFRAEPYTVKDLVNLGTMPLDLAVLLETCVRGRLNLLISGGTGSGKTTLLNVLSGFVPETERIVTVEDVFELQLGQPHVVGLESRPPNIEGRGEVTIRDLVRNVLRMRPDRIVVGECRGAEALDMLQAMNTGHEGSLTTVHANSPRDSLSRLETMVLMAGFDLPVRAIREQIASALDVVVHQERLRSGKRRVVEVAEVHGMEGDTLVLQKLFVYDYDKDRLEPTGLRPHVLDTLSAHGIEMGEVVR